MQILVNVAVKVKNCVKNNVYFYHRPLVKSKVAVSHLLITDIAWKQPQT